MSTEILDLDGVRVRFGGNVAVDGVSLSVAAGSVLGLVGPNGAGKTTLFNAISGLVRVSGGRIVLHRDGGAVELTRVGAWRRPGLGIGRTFQDSRLIEHLPVIDQLCSGALCRGGGLGAVLRGRRFLRRERKLVDDAMAILDGLGIADRATTSIDVLSAPERRLVDLGRAMMSRPDILLLDEISAGMPPEDREMVTRYVRDAAGSGTTVIFVEHDMAFVRRLADRVVVMAEGGVLADGEPGEVLRRADVLEAYIGPGAVEIMR